MVGAFPPRTQPLWAGLAGYTAPHDVSAANRTERVTVLQLPTADAARPWVRRKPLPIQQELVNICLARGPANCE